MMFYCGHVETQTRTPWLVLQMCFCPHVKASRVEFVAELVLSWYLYSYVISRHSLTTYIYSSCSTQHYVYTYVCIYLPAYLPTYHLPTYLSTFLSIFILSMSPMYSIWYTHKNILFNMQVYLCLIQLFSTWSKTIHPHETWEQSFRTNHNFVALFRAMHSLEASLKDSASEGK